MLNHSTPAAVNALPTLKHLNNEAKSPNDRAVAVAAAMRALEYEVYSVRKLAQVLRDLIDKEVNAGAPAGTYGVVLDGGARESLEFMSDELVGRASHLEKAYHGALKGKKESAQ